jgi:hypothetical protein
MREELLSDPRMNQISDIIAVRLQEHEMAIAKDIVLLELQPGDITARLTEESDSSPVINHVGACVSCDDGLGSLPDMHELADTARLSIGRIRVAILIYSIRDAGDGLEPGSLAWIIGAGDLLQIEDGFLRLCSKICPVTGGTTSNSETEVIKEIDRGIERRIVSERNISEAITTSRAAVADPVAEDADLIILTRLVNLGVAKGRAGRLDCNDAGDEIGLDVGGKPGHGGTAALAEEDALLTNPLEEVLQHALCLGLALRAAEFHGSDGGVVDVRVLSPLRAML